MWGDQTPWQPISVAAYLVGTTLLIHGAWDSVRGYRGGASRYGVFGRRVVEADRPGWMLVANLASFVVVITMGLATWWRQPMVALGLGAAVLSLVAWAMAHAGDSSASAEEARHEIP